MLRRLFLTAAEWSVFDWLRLQRESAMRQQQRNAEDEAARVAIRDKERRLALVALDKALHAHAKGLAAGAVDGPAWEAYREALGRAYRAEKD